MTDRIKEEEYLKAKRFAERVDGNYLEKGVSALSQLPYFSGLMVESGLNPNSKEHCELAKQSLEEKLKAAGSEMIVKYSEKLSEIQLNAHTLEGFYRIKEELFRIYENYFPLEKVGLSPFKTKSNILIGCLTTTYFKENSLYIETIDNNECSRKIPLRMAAIKIGRTLFRRRLKATATYTYTAGYNDYAIYYGFFRDFDKEADIACKSSLEDSLSADRFLDYTKNVLSALPKNIKKELVERIAKRKHNWEELTKRLDIKLS